MKLSNNSIKPIVLVFALLLLECYAFYLTYRAVSLTTPYLITILLFVPCIVWLQITKPLSKVLAGHNAQRLSRWVSIFIWAGIIIVMIEADRLGAALGGFALVPVNVLLAAACLVEPEAAG